MQAQSSDIPNEVLDVLSRFCLRQHGRQVSVSDSQSYGPGFETCYFLKSKNFCKEYSVEQKQIKSKTAAYSKLQMFGGKTCHACTQLEHVFSSHAHA